MNNHSSPHHIPGTKSVRSYNQERISVTAEQIGQIPCMIRMLSVLRIIMAAGFSIFCTAAIIAFMDMKSKESGFCLWQSPNLSNHQSSFPFAVEPNNSRHTGTFPSPDTSHSIGSVKDMYHRITSYKDMILGIK